jgi:Tfp pilus assembly protein PilO
VVLAVVVALAAPAGAASSSTAASAARRKQAEVRAAKAKAAAKLNALKASDDELEKAVDALATQVRAALAPLVGGREVDVHVADVDTGDQTPTEPTVVRT